MGKFGKHRLPKFMESDNSKVNESPNDESSHLNEEHPIEIVSLGEHGDDHAMIIIRTHDGEEMELRFDYDGDGMLTAQHGDHEYSIPVEVEVVDEPSELEEEPVDEAKDRMLLGGMLNLTRSLINKWNPAESEISGVISGIDESEGTPMLTVKNEEGQTIASIMYDKNSGQFIDGLSSWSIVYTPNDAKSERLLQNFFDNYYSIEDSHIPTFEAFVNECWSPMVEGYNPAMSEEAKKAIKTICEELLIKEAQTCDEDADPNHTYENYLNECGSYMNECMMEAASNLDVK